MQTTLLIFQVKNIPEDPFSHIAKPTGGGEYLVFDTKFVFEGGGVDEAAVASDIPGV